MANNSLFQTGTGNSTSGPATSASYTGPFTSGVAFKVTSSGLSLLGYYIWRADSPQSASATFGLWTITGANTGTFIAGSSVSTSGMTTGAWNFIALSTPVALTSGTSYKAVYGAPNNFPDTSGQTGTGGVFVNGVTSGPLVMFSDIGARGGTNPEPANTSQGTFGTAGSDPTVNFPSTPDSTSNFWVDVLVGPAAAAPGAAALAGTVPGWFPGAPGLPGGQPFAAWPPWDQVVAGAASVSVTAGLATGTGAAQAPVAALGANAAVATGTGAAQAPVAALGVNAADPAGTGTAQAPIAAIAVNAGLASGTGTAQQPTVSTVPVTSAPAGAATGTGAAQSPLAAIGVNAGAATGTGTAQQASVTTSGSANANAGLASGTGTAQPPVAAIGVNAGAATGTATAQAATGQASRTVNAGLAAATGAAQAPALALAALANASAATALGAALNAAGTGVEPFTVGFLTSGQVTPTSALTAGTGP